MQRGFDLVDAELRELRAEIGATHRLRVRLSIGIIATVALSFPGLLLSHA